MQTKCSHQPKFADWRRRNCSTTPRMMTMENQRYTPRWASHEMMRAWDTNLQKKMSRRSSAAIPDDQKFEKPNVRKRDHVMCWDHKWGWHVPPHMFAGQCELNNITISSLVNLLSLFDSTAMRLDDFMYFLLYSFHFFLSILWASQFYKYNILFSVESTIKKCNKKSI